MRVWGKRGRARVAAAGLLVATLLLALAPTAGAQSSDPDCRGRNETYRLLLRCVNAQGIREHLRAFQEIAEDNASPLGLSRASGLPGYEDSVDYVQNVLRGAGFDTEVQEFEFPFFQVTAGPTVEVVAPEAAELEASALTFSGSGTVTAVPVQAVDVTIPPPADPAEITSGCQPEDFEGFTPGNIALIQRGGCNFIVKAQNALDAGAVAVLVFNSGTPDRLGVTEGTLGEPFTIPVLGLSFADGAALAATPGATVSLSVATINETRVTQNVIGESRWGDDDNVVMAGAHLDSVTEGPGINDNGSGVATLLEIAQNLRRVRPENTIRLGFWGAEEVGLLGSAHYVETLTPVERADIALYLNFDMVGSPNYVRFVYDGDQSDIPAPEGTPIPAGSAEIEATFQEYFTNQGLASDPTAFDGRSDYEAFIFAGIPAGGLFSGAEGIKTEEQAAIYGGTAGAPYDPCYHQACDTLRNVNNQALNEFSDAAAYTLLTFAFSTESVNGVPGRPVPGRPLRVPGDTGDGAPGRGDQGVDDLHPAA